MRVAIIKYNAGNTQSVIYALKRLGIDPILTDDEHVLRSADKVIFPGVGEASSAMTYLRASGLDQIIPTLTQPTLGICIGLQLMCSFSEEGSVDCLNVFPQKVTLFNSGGKVPQMGWNSIEELKGPLFDGLPHNPYVYYVHSYYAPVNEHTIATTKYNNVYSAALQKDNFVAVQFHPEKSGPVGEQILKNFIHEF